MITSARLVRRIASAAAALVVAGGMATAAQPAEAAGWTCSAWQHKEFATSGYNTDVDVRFCIKRYTVMHSGYAEVKWRDGGGWAKKFDNFDVKLRLERYDKDYDHVTCSLESQINLYESQTRACTTGHYVESSSKKTGGWSVDGYIAYDLDADGKGGKTWSLKGTPLIK